jgi:NAD(P)-dependent dehydrogenase (short-subunit alcohol dehydrogenase family)
MRISLAGKVALVTGAAGGIGRAVVHVLGEAGAEVVGVDLPGRAIPGARQVLACDLADREAIGRLAADLAELYDRLDILVHCAGVTRDAVLWKLADADWESVMRVNLDSAFYLLRGTVSFLRKAGGAVVLIASINGERGKFGQSNYAASKAGLIGLGRTMARELGRFDVRVNLVAPGLIRTAMAERLAPEMVEEARLETVLGRIGEPEDVAGAVLFLCSDLSRHVTGQVLRVDGGQLIG